MLGAASACTHRGGEAPPLGGAAAESWQPKPRQAHHGPCRLLLLLRLPPLAAPPVTGRSAPSGQIAALQTERIGTVVCSCLVSWLLVLI